MSTSPADASLSIACPIPRHRLAYKSVTRHLTYTLFMAGEDTVLEEAMDNLKEAGGRIRATQSLMRSEGMTNGETYRDLLMRLYTALAMTEAAYLEARRSRL
jgi:hypothetical protein